jgi:hypothetical protein
MPLLALQRFIFKHDFRIIISISDNLIDNQAQVAAKCFSYVAIKVTLHSRKRNALLYRYASCPVLENDITNILWYTKVYLNIHLLYFYTRDNYILCMINFNTRLCYVFLLQATRYKVKRCILRNTS